MKLGLDLVSIKKMLEIKQFFRFLVANSEWIVILYMLLVSAGLSVPIGLGEGGASIGHLLVFIPYGFFFGLMSPDFLLLIGFPIYGEFIQLFFPWKYFDLADMSINIVGAFIGFFIAISIKRRIVFS